MTQKKNLGDYSIIKPIGQGCLGKVFLAEHRFIKKHYAIKVLPEELSSDKAFILRFEKEISMLAQLDHPHIVKVHNISYADGYYFLVMDCIVDAFSETTNLADFLKVHQCKMQEMEFVNILSQVASALDYAHQKKVADHHFLHRGLKLNNILVGKSEKGLHLYVSDFGLSKIIGEGSLLARTYKVLADTLCVDAGNLERYSTTLDPKQALKLQESFLQTYSFLAPEQKDTLSKIPLTPRTDTFAFGVLAYYLLTKKYPEGIFPMPSKIHTGLKLDWDDLLQKCLQYNPNIRPVNLTDVMTQLRSQERRVFQEEPRPHFTETKAPSYVAPSYERAAPSTHLPRREESFEPKQEYFQQVAMLEEEVLPPIQELKPVIKPTEVQRPTYEEDPSAVFTLESTVARYIPQEKEKKEVEPILTEMSMIQGGEYFRGSNENGRDERPKHLVRLSSFALDIHPVTNEQFVRFLEVMGGEKDVNNNDIIRLRESRIKRLGGKLIIESGYAKHPVVGVSWYGATAYAKWIGKRLPTEAEWEIAATSGIPDVTYPTGGDIERSEANFFSADTVNVMSYPPNQFGLYDMPGNVYEWCQDWYDYSYYEHSAQEPEDPKGPHQGVYRVLRGGCWKSLKDDLRCSHRHRNNPGTVNKTYGFRCCADVK